MGDELKYSVSKKGVGDIYESCDISLKKTLPTSHAVSQALFMYALVILQCLFCHAFVFFEASRLT